MKPWPVLAGYSVIVVSRVRSLILYQPVVIPIRNRTRKTRLWKTMAWRRCTDGLLMEVDKGVGNAITALHYYSSVERGPFPADSALPLHTSGPAG